MNDDVPTEQAAQDLVEALTRATGIVVPHEDRRALVREFLHYLHGLRTLDDVPESDEPILGFDPRWR